MASSHELVHSGGENMGGKGRMAVMRHQNWLELESGTMLIRWNADYYKRNPTPTQGSDRAQAQQAVTVVHGDQVSMLSEAPEVQS